MVRQVVRIGSAKFSHTVYANLAGGTKHTAQSLIIFRYLLRELLSTTFAVCAVLLTVIVSARFVKYLKEAALGKFDADVLLAFMGYRLPSFIELILPLSFFIAVLLAYGRLYLDSEMTVLKACGMSQRRLLGYTMLTALVVAAMVGWLTLSVSPSGIQKFNELELAQEQRGELDAMPAKRFHRLSARSGVAYAEEVKDGRLSLVFHTENRPSSADENQLVVVLAETGYQQRSEDGRENFLVLEDGYRIEGTAGQANFRITRFAEFGKRLAATRNWQGKEPEAEAMSTQDLMASDRSDHLATLHWRISLPLLVLTMAMVAVPLSKTNARQGRYFKLLPAVLLYLIYLMALKSGQDKVRKDELSVYIGIWGVHLVFLLFAFSVWGWGSLRHRLSVRRIKRVVAE